MERQFEKEFIGLKDLRQKFVRLQHHENVYSRSLEERITPKGLRLNKTLSLGRVSSIFLKRWRNILFEAEQKLLKLLKKEANLNQVKIGELFQKRIRELTGLRGDQIVKDWFMALEELEVGWRENLAERRRRKFANWTYSRAKRKRRELSAEAMKDLRELVKRNEDHNKQLLNSQGKNDEMRNLNESNDENKWNDDEYVDGDKDKFKDSNVVNLSQRELSVGEISLLSKGLKFCPTPREQDRSSIKRDLKEFGRRIKCKYHFLSNPKKLSEQNFTQFKEKSVWCPTIEDPVIDIYLRKLEERVNEINEKGRNYSNLQVSEQQALRILKNDQHIVIKEADKGGALVVWDRDAYCKEAYRQLNDKEVYEVIEGERSEILGKVSKVVAMELDSFVESGYINVENKKYLVVREPRLGRLYLLPKIHKCLENVPGRPVISNCGTVTERISEFLDFHIQPLVYQFIPSVIKDTFDFLQKLQNLGHIPATAILCTIDVIGLYPHIPHGEGLDSLQKILEKAGSGLPVEKLVSLAKIILENNYFEFDEKIFRQKLGTAIGTKFAPGFANVFMGFLEEGFIESCEFKPWVWWRFLDDIFMIWLHSEEHLNVFLSRLNTFHETIKYTWEISFDRIPFLDVTVTVCNGEFDADVYRKPTDAHQYLNYASCHPPHVRKGIPYGQGLRLKRICSSEEKFENRLGELRGFLVKRGYNAEFVERQFDRVRKYDCRNLQRDKRDVFSERICLVLDYHPALIGLNDILEDLQKVVGLSADFLKVLPEKPLLSFRRPRNLKDHLVRSKLRNWKDSGRGMVKCGKKRCQVCLYITLGNEFQSSVFGKRYFINHTFDCDSEGIVYLITCETCRLQYVGNTVAPFRLRFNNHKSSLVRFGKGQKDICGRNLYAHFYEEGHRGLKDLKVQIIDVTDVNKPNERESFWIEKLSTYCPKGLNIREES